MDWGVTNRPGRTCPCRVHFVLRNDALHIVLLTERETPRALVVGERSQSDSVVHIRAICAGRHHPSSLLCNPQDTLWGEYQGHGVFFYVLWTFASSNMIQYWILALPWIWLACRGYLGISGIALILNRKLCDMLQIVLLLVHSDVELPMLMAFPRTRTDLPVILFPKWSNFVGDVNLIFWSRIHVQKYYPKLLCHWALMHIH